MTRNTRRPASLSILAAGFVGLVLVGLVLTILSGCQIHRNAHGYQATPPISSLTSVPQGARVVIDIPSIRKLELTTPCDLPTELRKHHMISVTKEGYLPWKGPIGELPQTARATYKVTLQPIVPTE